MHSYELFAKMPPELALEIISAADNYDKPLYKELLSELAKVRRTRPVVIQRLSRNERHPWIVAMLSQPPAAHMAFRCVANWLLETQQQMLVQFLDDLGIAHDGKGAVDDVPEEPSRERLLSAVERLLLTFDRLKVAIYLHAFVLMSPHWNELAKILQTHPQLSVGMEENGNRETTAQVHAQHTTS